MAVLVEWYAASPSARTAAESAIRDVLATGRMVGVRFLGSVFIPGDATAFFLFDGADEDTVRRLVEAAGVSVDRLVEADAHSVRGFREEFQDVP